ncbi:transposase [Streptomyces sp. HUAS TT3]|uniref:transposase n=1 Tax=Streptomyces sp. HUAS TT3 TaxID=3447510 RepID=UPI003F65FDF5
MRQRGRPSDRGRRYPSDTTDAEWATFRPLLTVPAWFQGRGGRPEGYCHRQLTDRYLVAGGSSGRAMPADLPAWDRVHAFFRRWREHLMEREQDAGCLSHSELHHCLTSRNQRIMFGWDTASYPRPRVGPGLLKHLASGPAVELLANAVHHRKCKKNSTDWYEEASERQRKAHSTPHPHRTRHGTPQGLASARQPLPSRPHQRHHPSRRRLALTPAGHHPPAQSVTVTTTQT